MKIGIVTYHRTLNYGACLQAIATRVVLERLGHEVYYVDYWPEYHKDAYKTFSIKRLLKLGLRSKYYYLVEFIRFHNFRKKRIDNFAPFFEKYITPYCKPCDESFDVIIYGSDQIWRKQGALKDYNPVYFGENAFIAPKHIAYSASMGILPTQENDLRRIKQLISNLDCIAVREQNLKNLLESLDRTDVSLTLDPTLLLNAEQWDSILPTPNTIRQKYVLVYGISSVPIEMSEIIKFAHSRGCSVKVLLGVAKEEDGVSTFTTQDPSMFISLIKSADFVITSSFHGLVFSIIYAKEFLASYMGNSNRAETLLKILGIEGRILKNGESIPQHLPQLDYSQINNVLKKKVIESTKYIVNSINIE